MKFIKRVVIIPALLIITIISGNPLFAENVHEKPVVNTEIALSNLLDGNDRFVKGEMKSPHDTPFYRSTLIDGQNPFAIIVTCSDSRVSPELIFDQGLGDVFIIRNAGNVIDPDVLGTIEYAVEHLGTKFVMVLGHENCGAVKASLAEEIPEGNIASLVKAIKPAVEKAKKDKGDLYENSIVENINQSVQQIKNSDPIIKESILNSGVKVVGAFYNLHTGKVNILD